MRSSYLTINGIKLHVVTDGPETGPLVLLLHGFPEHWPSYRHQIPVLAHAGYRVIVPDQRGYNLSEKPGAIRDYSVDTLALDMVKLIESQGRNEAIVVGHDWGGVVAHHMAMHHPSYVRKLIILNSPHPRAMKREMKRLGQLMRSSYFFYFLMPKIPESIFTLFPKGSARLLLRSVSALKEVHKDDDIENVAKAISQPGAMTAMLNWYRASFMVGKKVSTKNINAPTLVIWGEKDPALGLRLTENLEPWFSRDFTIEKIPTAGHWVQHEAAEEVNKRLLAFIR